MHRFVRCVLLRRWLAVFWARCFCAGAVVESGEVLSKTTGVLEAPGKASYNNKNGFEEGDRHA